MVTASSARMETAKPSTRRLCTAMCRSVVRGRGPAASAQGPGGSPRLPFRRAASSSIIMGVTGGRFSRFSSRAITAAPPPPPAGPPPPEGAPKAWEAASRGGPGGAAHIARGPGRGDGTGRARGGGCGLSAPSGRSGNLCGCCGPLQHMPGGPPPSAAARTELSSPRSPSRRGRGRAPRPAPAASEPCAPRAAAQGGRGGGREIGRAAPAGLGRHRGHRRRARPPPPLPPSGPGESLLAAPLLFCLFCLLQVQSALPAGSGRGSYI